jgi:hypothetical protein
MGTYRNLKYLMQPLRGRRLCRIFFYYNETATLYQDNLPSSGYNVVDQPNQSETLPRSGYIFYN